MNTEETHTKENLAEKIIAVLFYVAEPVLIKYLAEMLGVTETDITEAMTEMPENILHTGLCVVAHDGTLALTTRPDMSGIIEKIVKDEHERDLGKGSLETLAIVAYKGPVSRKEIEYIRGVNCQFALRTLLLRGLIEKKSKDGDERVVMYGVTLDALRHLGIQKIEDLPEYGVISKKLEVEDEPEIDLDAEVSE